MIATIDEVVAQNNKLVYSICSRYNNYSDKEDLYQVGMIGLINAYNNFDSSKNVKFSTYAFPYIIGEVNRYVRENKNIKISKDLVKLGRKIKEYVQKHYEVRGYEPSVKQIANMLEISESKVISALEASNSVKSLDQSIGNDDKEITLLDTCSANETISKEQLMDLKEAFKYLSKEEQQLVINRYFNNLTQGEVAEILGVNQVYVSRLEQKVLVKMKNKML